MIAKCPNPNCPAHDYQDNRYGKGNRVMNPVMVKGKIEGWRCTVCSPPKEAMKKRGGVFSLDQIKKVG